MILKKRKDGFVLAYLDPYDNIPVFFERRVTPEDVIPVDEEKEAYLMERLKPKIIKVAVGYAIVELWGKKFEIWRSEFAFDGIEK